MLGWQFISFDKNTDLYQYLDWLNKGTTSQIAFRGSLILKKSMYM